MFGCKPDLELTALLREATKNPPTEEQLRAQRRSWVRGETAMGSDRACRNGWSLRGPGMRHHPENA